MSIFDFIWTPEARQKWEDQISQDLNLDVTPQPVLTAKKIGYYTPITRAALEEHEEWLEGMRAFRALPPEEQARIRAEQEAKAAADKLARTCEHCGCDPDEHGDRS